MLENVERRTIKSEFKKLTLTTAYGDFCRLLCGILENQTGSGLGVGFYSRATC